MMRKWKMFGMAVAIGIGVLSSPDTASAANILVNEGFETGALAPWFNSDDFCGGCLWDVTNTDAHTGSFSATVDGNILLEQSFAAVSAGLVNEASVWLRMPETGIAFVGVRYGDSSFDGVVFNVGSAWAKFDLAGFLNPALDVIGFGVFGCTGCPGASVTFADDFVFDVGPAVPEPTSLLLFGTSAAVAAVARRRRHRRILAQRAR